MNHRRGWLGVAVLGAIALGVVYARSKPAAVPADGELGSAALGEAAKARIVEFWSTFRHAQSLRRQGHWEPAIDGFLRALELDPRHQDALYGLANCYIEIGRFEAALAALERLAESDPLGQRAYLQIGLIRSYPGAGDVYDLDAAEAALRRAVEINQEESGAFLRLAEVMLVKGDPDRAFELYALANRSNFRAVEGYYVRAYLRWRAGRAEEAVELLTEAVRQSRAPTIVAGVPGEGDNRPGSTLPPSSIDENRMFARVWNGLAGRFPGGAVTASALDAEFAALDAELRAVAR
ncbi:MAG: tetratricopeptide repeat protein [Planctomycetes bacterium]|nr:tetratricopeptide repeat protein [Planctomycetota bacterium]